MERRGEGSGIRRGAAGAAGIVARRGCWCFLLLTSEACGGVTGRKGRLVEREKGRRRVLVVHKKVGKIKIVFRN